MTTITDVSKQRQVKIATYVFLFKHRQILVKGASRKNKKIIYSAAELPREITKNVTFSASVI